MNHLDPPSSHLPQVSSLPVPRSELTRSLFTSLQISGILYMPSPPLPVSGLHQEVSYATHNFYHTLPILNTMMSQKRPNPQRLLSFLMKLTGTFPHQSEFLHKPNKTLFLFCTLASPSVFIFFIFLLYLVLYAIFCCLSVVLVFRLSCFIYIYTIPCLPLLLLAENVSTFSSLLIEMKLVI